MLLPLISFNDFILPCNSSFIKLFPFYKFIYFVIFLTSPYPYVYCKYLHDEMIESKLKSSVSAVFRRRAAVIGMRRGFITSLIVAAGEGLQ